MVIPIAIGKFGNFFVPVISWQKDIRFKRLNELRL
jgi:heme/copper-type cytochrome/quinol oxidase subunit 1